MKIGIITFNSAHNYGAVLQAWALQEYLTGQGYEVGIINYRLPQIDNVYRLFTPETPYRLSIMNRLHQKRQYLKVLRNSPKLVHTYRKFERFIRKRLNTTCPYYSFKELKAAKPEFDILIAGSDQIWNGAYTKGVNPGFFLAFGPACAKRISYAASIGKDRIPVEEQESFRQNLQRFDYLSVREQKGKDEIEKLTNQPVAITVDPTFLIPREHFDTIRRNPSIKKCYIYVHNVHLKKQDDRLLAVAEELSGRSGLPVVYNRSGYSFSNELPAALDNSPEEFLGWIASAEYVVTNSFHATVFALIYHRNFITIPATANPERMKHLLESLDLSNHLMETAGQVPASLEKLFIDYTEVDQKRTALTEKSHEFLKNALNGPKTTVKLSAEEGSFLRTGDRFGCFGCGICAETCSQHAIKMEYDDEGFLYPVIQKELCMDCGSCIIACETKIGKDKAAAKSEEKEETEKAKEKAKEEAKEAATDSYCAKYRPDSLPMLSFTESALLPFYRSCIQKQGKVISRSFDEKLQPVYRIIESEDELVRISGGIIPEADLSVGRKLIGELLKQGERVLFIGNPCETAAMREAFPHQEGRLFTIGFLCKGITSEKVFGLYRKSLETLYESELKSISASNLIRGWKTPHLCAEFSSGEVLLEPAWRNLYYKQFVKHRFNRPSCYTCSYFENVENYADLVIGPYLGGSFTTEDRYEGMFILSTANEFGRQLISECSSSFVLQKEQKTELMTGAQKEHFVLNNTRKTFIKKLETMDIMSLLNEK